jgi:hypothetical protein
MAAKFGTPREFTDSNGVYAIEYPWNLVHDATWGKALVVTLTNVQATL